VSGSLVVPIEVAAFVVNEKTRLKNFARWQLQFTAMGDYSSVEPDAFGAPTDFGDASDVDGVYLSWTLPWGLRQGAHDLAGGKTTFKNVPNRWLVVRYSGAADVRVAKSWVVESDFLDPNNATSPYVDPLTSQPTHIGQKIDLSLKPWQDVASGTPFLTAVGPGLATFAGYQPYNEDVFSIHDRLDDAAVDDTLSYFVVGWYTSWGGDPLATGDFATTIGELGWTVDEPAATADQSIFCGRALGVGWHKNGEPPDPQRPDAGGVSLAIGNTSIDALTALIGIQAAEDPVVDPQLLEAFQYGILDHLDSVDGQAELARRAHDASFGSASAGGFAWQIVDDPASVASPPDADELATEEAWLATLNQAQQDYDAAARKLAADRAQLYTYWWAYGVGQNLTTPPNGLSDDLSDQLDPTQTDGLAYSVLQQAADLASKVANGTIPAGSTQAELQNAIDLYQQKQGLPAGRLLKRVVRPAFELANDPVVLLTATGSSGIADPGGEVACRFADEITTALKWSGGTVEGAAVTASVPGPALTGMPDVTRALLTEFFLLDPANATMIAQAIGSTDPATIAALAAAAGAPAESAVPAKAPVIGFDTWGQPWQPLYLLWEVDYWPIAHDVGGAPTWEFDGTQYTWNGKGAGTDSLSFSGRTLLTPQAVFNFQAQLERYEKTHPDPDLDTVEKFIASTDKWDVLSQALDGLGTMLALRDPSARMAPPADIAALVADQDRAAPAAEAFPVKPNFGQWPASQFQPYRSGQISLSQLTVVDRFGQTIEVVTTQNNKQINPTVAPDLQPTGKVGTEMPVAQLPPRALQPARLTFDLIDAVHDSETVGLDVGANPVCAWTVRNYVDDSLLFFDQKGGALGEVRVVTDSTATPVAWWDATPGSQYATVPDLATDFPHLAGFLAQFVPTDPADPSRAAHAQDFATLLAVIDQTLPLIDPPGGSYDDSMAVLIGRPLVLLRARAQLELDGPPLPDPSWEFFFEPQTPALPGYEFPIRLGDLARLGDGLLGYFTGDQYDQLNAVYVPSGTTRYAAQIGGQSGNYLTLDFGAASSSYLTLLADPRAPVHALTDILPTAALTLPPEFIAGPLGAIDLTFRTGPLLTTKKAIKTGTALVMPKPSGRHGTWTWVDGDGSSWPIAPADQSASLPASAKVRSGWLDLAGGAPS
jgi:hypothetical protein